MARPLDYGPISIDYPPRWEPPQRSPCFSIPSEPSPQPKCCPSRPRSASPPMAALVRVGSPETTMSWLLLAAAPPVQGLGAAANRRLPAPMGSHRPAARGTGSVIELNAVQGASLVYQCQTFLLGGAPPDTSQHLPNSFFYRPTVMTWSAIAGTQT